MKLPLLVLSIISLMAVAVVASDSHSHGESSQNTNDESLFWERYLQNSIPPATSVPTPTPTFSTTTSTPTLGVPPTIAPIVPSLPPVPTPTVAPPTTTTVAPTTIAPVIPAPTTVAPVATTSSPTVTTTTNSCANGATILNVACANEDFASLCTAVNATGLSPVLDDPNGNFTVFAPVNTAFDAIAPILPTLSLDDLMFVLLYHVSMGKFSSNDLVCNGSLMMANELSTITQCLDGQGIFQVGTGNVDPLTLPQIVLTNIEACNGVIHVIDNVILPDAFP